MSYAVKHRSFRRLPKSEPNHALLGFRPGAGGPDVAGTKSTSPPTSDRTAHFVTSAGASAGMDMCLHLIVRDHGQAAAAHSARLAVAPLRRDGGQAQFIPHDSPRTTDSLARLLDWVLANLDERLDVERLAARAAPSPRTFGRRFRRQAGTTPLQWILAARVHRAQERLETCDESIETIAKLAGFEAPVTFRTRFQQVFGLSPAAYRRRFRSGEAPMGGTTSEPRR